MSVAQSNPFGSSTRESLLRNFANHQFQDSDTAVTFFLKKYKPIIRLYLQNLRLNDCRDNDDLEQEILLKVLKSLKHFDRRGTGSFRAWLKTIIQSVHIDWIRKLENEKKIQKMDPQEIEKLGESIGMDFARQHDKEMMELALARAKLEFNPEIWKKFELFQLKGLDGEEVASQLSTTVYSVYAASRRVVHRLRDLLVSLDRFGDKES